MASITIQQLAETTKRKLKIRAAEHGRSRRHARYRRFRRLRDTTGESLGGLN
jgi:plasmid stability protein